jgi:hypothetical protein
VRITTALSKAGIKFAKSRQARYVSAGYATAEHHKDDEPVPRRVNGRVGRIIWAVMPAAVDRVTVGHVITATHGLLRQRVQGILPREKTREPAEVK